MSCGAEFDGTTAAVYGAVGGPWTACRQRRSGNWWRGGSWAPVAGKDDYTVDRLGLCKERGIG